MLRKMKKYLIIKLFRNMEEFEINMKELKEKQLNNATIVDVRSLQEYNEGHIEGAINIPYYEINKKINKIISNKENEIVLYCEMGGRSKRAYRILKKLGYKKIYSLFGGLENFQ